MLNDIKSFHFSPGDGRCPATVKQCNSLWLLVREWRLFIPKQYLLWRQNIPVRGCNGNSVGQGGLQLWMNGRQHSSNLTYVNLFVKVIMLLSSFLIPTDWLPTYLPTNPPIHTSTHPPNYQPTNQSFSESHEADLLEKKVEKFCTFCGTLRLIAIFTGACHFPPFGAVMRKCV